jgi:hypothetical protein
MIKVLLVTQEIIKKEVIHAMYSCMDKHFGEVDIMQSENTREKTKLAYHSIQYINNQFHRFI